MRKKSISILIILLIIGAGLGYFYSRERPRRLPSEVYKTTHISGVLNPPKNIPPDKFSIVSLNEVGTSNNQGQFQSRVYKEGVGVVGAMVSDKEFGLLRIVVTQNGVATDEFIIDEKSTAVGLLFTTPFFITNDPGEARKIIQVLENDSKVLEIANIINRNFSTELDFLDSPDYQKVAQEAVQSVLKTLNQPEAIE